MSRQQALMDEWEHSQHPQSLRPPEECGYKRNPHSSRPPCWRRAGHRGKHSYSQPSKQGR